MSMEIAVFLDDDGNTIPFNQSGIINVYLKEKDEWRIINKIIFEIEDFISTKIIRDNIKNMVESLSDCRVFVAGDVKGIPYSVLDGMGFSILQVEGNPKDFLELVFKGQEERKLIKEKLETIPTPVMTKEDGKYFINIRTEMENNKRFNSKQILLTFIQGTTFKELEIICGHVPQWLDGEFSKLNLKSDIENINEGTVKVKVYPNYH